MNRIDAKILIIDDDTAFGETLEILISNLGYKVSRTVNGTSGLEILSKQHPELVITDLKLPDMTGLDILKKVKEFDRQTQVIIITAYDNMETTIKAMQFGAYDYLEKAAGLERIKVIVKRALESKKLSDKLEFANSEDFSKHSLANSIIGKTTQMNEIFKKIGKVSSNRVNVLIQGESGTGKELIAKVIHYSGITKDDPFIGVNCTALTESLLESELFGHEKGSFTGAIKSKKGKFQLAGNGTVFLDEISELSFNLQVKLLRVIQEREFEKVGGEETIPMNARVIAASNKDLFKLVEDGSFREDLYYRLNVFRIEVPPLRERKDDIPLLVVHFLNKINTELHKNVFKIPYEVMELLQKNRWIGNVRELENILLQAVVLAQGDVLEKEYILLENNIPNELAELSIHKMTLAEVEKKYIKNILDEYNWNKKEASKILGIAKTTLYNKIEAYELVNEK
jgi:two-component system response regulator AtoC